MPNGRLRTRARGSAARCPEREESLPRVLQRLGRMKDERKYILHNPWFVIGPVYSSKQEREIEEAVGAPPKARGRARRRCATRPAASPWCGRRRRTARTRGRAGAAHGGRRGACPPHPDAGGAGSPGVVVQWRRRLGRVETRRAAARPVATIAPVDATALPAKGDGRLTTRALRKQAIVLLHPKR